MNSEEIVYRYLDEDLVNNLLNSDEKTIHNLGMKVTLLESLVKEDIKNYNDDRCKRECIEIYSNVINELRNIIYKYNLKNGISVDEGVYTDSVKPKLLYENNLIRGMEYMRLMFPPLDKYKLLDYLNNYTRLLCKHNKDDRYSEELWYKTKMCLKYLDGILFSSDTADETNFNAMTLENYLELMLNEDLSRDDASRYVRYLKRYKSKNDQGFTKKVESLFENRQPKGEEDKEATSPTGKIRKNKEEHEKEKPIIPPSENIGRASSNSLTVVFIIIAIIVIILLAKILI